MEMWRKIFTTAALAIMLCITGLVMSGEAQAQRFVDNGNGTVTDSLNGLMWTKEIDWLVKLNWDGAMARCESFSISGIGGWRLPNHDELRSLYHAMQGTQHPFPTYGGSSYSWFWSSTTYPYSISGSDTPRAYSVNMGNGNEAPCGRPTPSSCGAFAREEPRAKSTFCTRQWSVACGL